MNFAYFLCFYIRWTMDGMSTLRGILVAMDLALTTSCSGLILAHFVTRVIRT
jgi:hypothetical protein